MLRERKEVLASLEHIGLGKIMAEKVAEFFSFDLVCETLENNPYSLMQVDGISFAKADKIALNSYSISVNDVRRQRALTYKLLDDQKNLGHTYLPLIKLEQAMAKINISNMKLIDEMAANGEIVIEGNSVYTKRLYRAECGCASYVKERIS